ncbi:DTW domain-containing protein [Vibrio sp. UCD-FRSSP16_10]|uniref:tRNA-uridine aminocarboxypropyltransferase n=1 Tax=unclassified Vibrio TaxID=2614977 RepID=UPI0007FFB7AC|nr:MULTISPECIES: tRNA-uridine aminocarboxypropyltransferase [unclassified Vibrio]OBT12168.1 DTW domain-containing protein [Vibrio sp. UCD-FRSSP16_30]OBT20499.1 DTW domain-containing protein [Vibrio sp. UCD-FRSSP16_10]
MRVHAVHQLVEYRLSQSTKPFSARGSKVDRCSYCRIAQQHCICPYQSKPQSGLAVLLIYSENEVLKPSNTGRLIADICDDVHAYQWSRTEPTPEMLALLKNEQYQPILVFPEDYLFDSNEVISRDNEFLTANKIPLFIFLDASWREARRIYRKSDYLHHLPVMSIQPEKISEYVMRKSDHEQHLATCEVAALVFSEFNFDDASTQLQGWFEVFKESYMLSKTREKRDFSRPVLTRYLSK